MTRSFLHFSTMCHAIFYIFLPCATQYTFFCAIKNAIKNFFLFHSKIGLAGFDVHFAYGSTTFSITTLGITTLSIMTLSIKGVCDTQHEWQWAQLTISVTFSITDTQHNNAVHYAECCYTECRVLLIIMLWRTRIVCFKSSLLLNIQMYNMSLLHKYY